MAFQENLNDNLPTLSTVDLEDEETLIEYNELMEVDVEEVNSGQADDESEEDDENIDSHEVEDQYDDEDEDEDNNREDL